jgi:hypothetical protein
MPEQRFSVGKELKLSTLLRQCAAEVMRSIGGQGSANARTTREEVDAQQYEGPRLA